MTKRSGSDTRPTRRTLLKASGAALGGLTGIGLAGAKPAEKRLEVDPNDQESVIAFLKHLIKQEKIDQRRILNDLSKVEQKVVNKALTDFEIDTDITERLEVSTQGDISTTATSFYEAKNSVKARQKQDPSIVLWVLTHRVSWRVENGRIHQGSVSISQTGNTYPWTWEYKGDIGGTKYIEPDGLNTQEVGHFAYCPSPDVTEFCIKEADYKAVSNISGFPNGKRTKRGWYKHYKAT